MTNVEVMKYSIVMMKELHNTIAILYNVYQIKKTLKLEQVRFRSDCLDS
jgi:hypothetical protein